MRAKTGLALMVAFLLAAVGLTLMRATDVALSFARAIVTPAVAEDAPGYPTAVDPARPELPKFVPSSQPLARAADSDQAASSQSEGETSPPQGDDSPDAAGSVAASSGAQASEKPQQASIKVEPIPDNELPPKTVWPKFVGAKALFGEAKKPASLEARAIGSYSRGCLAGAVPLPIDGPAWQEMRLSRNRNWGHPQLIALVQRFAKDAQKLDGWPGLLVGDIAQPRGGPMITGHASHQIGLDADIWLTPMPKRRLSNKERETLEATSMLDSTGVAVDPKIFDARRVSLIKRAASYTEVERIFVHPAIKKALCKAASPTDRAWLGKVRPWFGHYYHFHIRIKCPAGFAGCTPQPAPTGDDGCGKEVDTWLSKVIPAKGPPVPKPPYHGPPRTPAPPIMMSDLPKECESVLASGPDAVKIPREALMTKIEVRKALAKAAAVNMALYKASAPAAAAKGTGGSLAKSPALAPHLKKAATADPK
jgi:penicillin-insensitive murein DD-endopeptidase